MGVETEIAWCDSTVNPTTGCDGCELWTKGKGGPCYAGNLHERRLSKTLPTLYAPTFTDVRLAPGRMAKAAAWPDLTDIPRPAKPWLDDLPRTIFVGDMGDIFSKDVPFDYLKSELIDVVVGQSGSRHVWMLLTKQATRAVAFSRWLVEEAGVPWPENVWAGVSVTSSKTEARSDIFSHHPAAVKFLSVEPLLGSVQFSASVLAHYRLVIVGGESGHGARPMHVDWVRSIRDQCVAAGVSFFFKQWGEWMPIRIDNDCIDVPVSDRVCAMTNNGNRRLFKRVGKKMAGRLLDGREWNEFPEPGA